MSSVHDFTYNLKKELAILHPINKYTKMLFEDKMEELFTIMKEESGVETFINILLDT